MQTEKMSKLTLSTLITLIMALISVTTYAVLLRSDASLCLDEIAHVKANDKLQDEQINDNKVTFAKIIEQMTNIQKDIAEMKLDVKSLR